MLARMIAGMVVGAAGVVMGGVVVSDGGFEGYSVAAGGFVKPASGIWSFANDAGVVRPYAPNSATALLFTWSATRNAYEGQQYASTYAGSDMITQDAAFPAAGKYELSVEAFAPGGTITIPDVLYNCPLTDGAFRFRFDHVNVGLVQTVSMNSDWTRYSTIVDVPAAGTYEVGVLNTATAPYFINYDAFAVQSIPEPATAGTLLVLGFALLRRQVTAHKPRRV